MFLNRFPKKICLKKINKTREETGGCALWMRNTARHPASVAPGTLTIQSYLSVTSQPEGYPSIYKATLALGELPPDLNRSHESHKKGTHQHGFSCYSGDTSEPRQEWPDSCPPQRVQLASAPCLPSYDHSVRCPGPTSALSSYHDCKPQRAASPDSRWTNALVYRYIKAGHS